MKMIDYNMALKECKKPGIYDLCDTPEFLSYLPKIEATPIIFSKFIAKFEGDDERYCAECGEIWNLNYNEIERFNYCPNCGAKIENDKED